MSLIGLLRKHGFWLLDAVSGRTVRRAYIQIKKIDMLDSNDQEIWVHQKNAWEQLKATACANTDFYKNMVSRDFLEFPIITKNDIRSQQNSFISSEYEKNSLIQMSTSGSTGTPFVCFQNREKKKRVNAEIIYYSEKAGYELGSNLSYIRTIVRQNKKSSLKQFLQNQTLINCMSLNDDGIEKIIQALKEKSRYGAVVLLGYGSTFTAIKNYAKKKEMEKIPSVKVVGVISGSDMLFDETRAAISDLFGGIPVISRYSNEENGVIGQDEGINNTFVLNEADYIIEIIDDDGKPAPDGESGHIVVTDLYNYAMPMIRYDTGDVGKVKTFNINGRNKKCICDFGGRSVDVIQDTKGTPLSPHVITNYMWSFPDVNQFQVIQTGEKQYKIRLNLPDGFERMDEMTQMLHNLIGEDAALDFEIVNGIPVLASGKRRYVVNEWKNCGVSNS